MPDIFGVTQAALSLKGHRLNEAISEVQELQAKLNRRDLAASRACLRLLRLCRARHAGQAVGAADSLALLRQVIRQYTELRVPVSWWDELASFAQRFNLQGINLEAEMVRVRADVWSAPWLPDSFDIDELEFRRRSQAVEGDGTLAAMAQKGGLPSPTYQSDGQRRAVQAALFAPPGTTTLITLPTGAGKSLCAILPAWLASRGGQSDGGTTLVIVPTVALAIDQCEGARRFFPPGNLQSMPQYISGGTPLETRQAVRRGIVSGTLPLVFMSPESLIVSEFHEIVSQAVEAGKVTRIVMDEAHLIETWGASFRTDFQLMSTYLRQLYEKSRGELRLLLLSATISEPARQTLEQLFTFPDGKFRFVRVNQLRPEVGYWMAKAPSKYLKIRWVLEALDQLPRPAILYVTAPADAEEWVARLRQAGYLRMATFTGDTDTDQRQAIIQNWHEDQLDLIVATSAFGLGVDKPDVRTIVHASLPETIDRFYQEVGRGGRDGCSSISLTVVTERDLDYPAANASRSRITLKLGWDRWEAMFRTASRLETGWSIDRQALRSARLRRSERNREWNEHVLLLMQRANVIRLREFAIAPDGRRDYDRIVVQIQDPDAVNSEVDFSTALTPVRELELAAALTGAKRLVEALEAQIGTSDQCLAETFAEVYTPVGEACGGCPSCRRARRLPYVQGAVVDEADLEGNAFRLPHSDLMAFAGQSPILQLITDSEPDEANGLFSLSLAPALVALGVSQMVVPDTWLNRFGMELVESLRSSAYSPQLLMSAGAFLSRGMYAVPAVAFLNEETSHPDRFYQKVMRWQQTTSAFLVIVVPRRLELLSLHGRFVDRVPGHQESVGRFLRWAQYRRTTL